jgi:ribosomal 50S subunit-recycling heat shock protein
MTRIPSRIQQHLVIILVALLLLFSSSSNSLVSSFLLPTSSHHHHHQHHHHHHQIATTTTSTALSAANRPPWQRKGRSKKEEEEGDALLLLELSLASPPSSSSSSSSSPTTVPLQQQEDQHEHLQDNDEDDDLLSPPPPPTAVETFIIKPHEAKTRADRFLAERLAGQSRSGLSDLFDQGLVLLNGAKARKAVKLSPGDTIEVLQLRSTQSVMEIEAENIPLNVLYEDEHIIAINKAPGMVVHPAPGNRNGTFVNALLYHVAQAGASIETAPGSEGRPGVVHRLDKGTSGVLIAAKTAAAHAGM